MSEISEAIKQAAMRGTELYLKLCTVDSVNESARTIDCTPADGTAQLIDVSLQSITDESNGLLIVPKKGSFVTIGFLDRNNAVVLLFSEIEKIVLNVSDTIEINGGKNGGLVLSEKVKSELDTVIQRVNDIVSALTTIATSLTSTDKTPVLGAALGSLITSNITSIITPLIEPQKKVFENDKITH